MPRNIIVRATPLLAIAAFTTPQPTSTSTSSNCQITGSLLSLPGLHEASGVAASRRNPGVFWAHNDGGAPEVFAIDPDGKVKARIRVTGANVENWEDIAVGPCAKGSCLYVADIGDNEGKRAHITVYRAPEPAATDTATAPAEAFHARYPDGAHDAESLFVMPDESIFLITKGDPGPVALFRFPRPLSAGRTITLEAMGKPLADGNVQASDRPTAADASPDGRWVAVRTTGWVAFYRSAHLTRGNWREASRTDVRDLRESLGEGVTFDGDNAVVLVGEGRSAGTFGRMKCRFPDH